MAGWKKGKHLVLLHTVDLMYMIAIFNTIMKIHTDCVTRCGWFHCIWAGWGCGAWGRKQFISLKFYRGWFICEFWCCTNTCCSYIKDIWNVHKMNPGQEISDIYLFPVWFWSSYRLTKKIFLRPTDRQPDRQRRIWAHHAICTGQLKKSC